MEENICLLINEAISRLEEMGLHPTLISLSDKDYQDLKPYLISRVGEDYADGNIKNLTFYKGIEVDNRLPDIDEVDNALYAYSFIATSSIYQVGKMIEPGRAFNLRTMEELF